VNNATGPAIFRPRAPILRVTFSPAPRFCSSLRIMWKIEDWLKDDAVWSEPYPSNSLLSGKNTGNFAFLKPIQALKSAQSPRDHSASYQNSLETRTGNADPLSGNCNSLIWVRTGTEPCYSIPTSLPQTASTICSCRCSLGIRKGPTPTPWTARSLNSTCER
jgi:hypothetical protein